MTQIFLQIHIAHLIWVYFHNVTDRRLHIINGFYMKRIVIPRNHKLKLVIMKTVPRNLVNNFLRKSPNGIKTIANYLRYTDLSLCSFDDTIVSYCIIYICMLDQYYIIVLRMYHWYIWYISMSSYIDNNKENSKATN